MGDGNSERHMSSRALFGEKKLPADEKKSTTGELYAIEREADVASRTISPHIRFADRAGNR
jgi:hypothetical protein